jgi:hypothetical protein
MCDATIDVRYGIAKQESEMQLISSERRDQCKIRMSPKWCHLNLLAIEKPRSLIRKKASLDGEDWSIWSSSLANQDNIVTQPLSQTSDSRNQEVFLVPALIELTNQLNRVFLASTVLALRFIPRCCYHGIQRLSQAFLLPDTSNHSIKLMNAESSVVLTSAGIMKPHLSPLCKISGDEGFHLTWLRVPIRFTQKWIAEKTWNSFAIIHCVFVCFISRWWRTMKSRIATNENTLIARQSVGDCQLWQHSTHLFSTSV